MGRDASIGLNETGCLGEAGRVVAQAFRVSKSKARSLLNRMVASKSPSTPV